MPKNLTMPRLSDTMEVGTIVKWHVKPGQKVKSGEVVADIETDKATMELQTFEDGVVSATNVAVGQSVPVGTLILSFEGGTGNGAPGGPSAGKPPASAESAAVRPGAEQTSKPGTPGEVRSGDSSNSDPAREVKPRGTPAPVSHGSEGTNGAARRAAPRADEADERDDDRIFASPLARKLAEQSGIELDEIEGTGPGGRIVRRDVEEAVAAGPRVRSATRRAREEETERSVGGNAPRTQPARGASERPVPRRQAGPLQKHTWALTNMRRTIATRLVESVTSIPHYQVSVSVRMDALLSLRQQLNEQLASQGVKLSVNDFLVRACALAMREHPYVNTRWVGTKGSEAIEFLDVVNVGVAIALPVAENGTGGGLLVATIRNADQIGLRQISAETKRLSEKARGKGLSIEDMSDSTFTISNLGMFGVGHFTAIINPPNTAILAVGAAVKKALVETRGGRDELVVGHEMQMTMSSDHRVIDGAMAAQYLATVKAMLEKPASLLV